MDSNVNSADQEVSGLRLPRLISDGMVLQRDAGVRIWGWACPGEIVTVEFSGQSYQTTAGKDGQWAVELSKMQAGGPYEMIVRAKQQITIQNILIGDVWICSGQSNMVLPMNRVKYRYADAIANSENLEIRQFLVPERFDFNMPQQDLISGNWVSANPETVLTFSATGYFFAKSLYEKYQVPIGLINASVGGSPAEAWMSEDALKAFPEHLNMAKRCKDHNYIRQIEQEEQARDERWYEDLNRRDQGLTGGEKPWFDPEYDASMWLSMQLPAYWEDVGLEPMHGVVWFQKEIEIPAHMAGKPARLWLGRIVDSDSVYVNGVWIGETTYQYPPRIYDVPANLLRPGKNSIVIRVVSVRERGGFIQDKPYRLDIAGENIDLKGEWVYKVGAKASMLPETTFFQYKPLGLFNGMIAPLLNCTIKGTVWYQGEANMDRAFEYHELFSGLIADWRRQWNQGDFPFLFVQLPNCNEADEQPSESHWAELREAQFQTLALPNTGMAVAIDVGEWNDLHPLNKEDVGKRLALVARKVAYGDHDVVYSGPVFRSIQIEGSAIIIQFTHADGGLAVKEGNELLGFAIAENDGKFVWAKARIENGRVIVWNDRLAHPVAVRYAWADNPKRANLSNKAGLPAIPFRTQ